MSNMADLRRSTKLVPIGITLTTAVNTLTAFAVHLSYMTLISLTPTTKRLF